VASEVSVRRLFLLLLPVAVLGSEPQVQRKLDAPLLTIKLHVGDQEQRLAMGYSGSLPDSVVLVLSGETEERRVYRGRLDTAAVAR